MLIERQIGVELFAIWLPSLIGAGSTRFTSENERLSALTQWNQFLMQLHFIKVRIYAPALADFVSAEQIFRSNLRLFAKIVAQYNERGNPYAISDLPQVPI